MGYYINPPDMDKERFLADTGTLYKFIPEKHRDGDMIVVCLVDNGDFTAAAICYNQDELEAFSDLGDPRRKVWFGVPLDKLEPYIKPELVDASSITKGRRGEN